MKLVPIFEAVVIPHDFEIYLERLVQVKRVNSIEKLNEIFDNKVQFITLEQYKELNPEATLPRNTHIHIQSQGGVGMGTVLNNQIYIGCDPKTLLRNLNSYSRGRMIQMIRLIIRHESIHIQQIEKSGGKLKDIDKAESEEDYKKYLASKEEIMAYAQTIVDDLVFSDFSYDEILDMLKRRGTFISQYGTKYYQIFKDEPKVLNRLYKMIYLYTIHGKEQEET